MDPEVFDIFIKECLVPVSRPGENYTDIGTDTEEGAVQLLYSKYDEAEVYHRVPYDIPLLSNGMLNQYGITTPGKLYCTNHKTAILDPADHRWVAKTYSNFTCQEFTHSHFWPLEDIGHFSDAMAGDIVDILVSDRES